MTQRLDADATGSNEALALRTERVWAANMVAMASALAASDPSWRTDTFPLADGHAVLLGGGQYVNRVLAAGLQREVTDADLGRLERRSAMVGVVPAFEVSELTIPSVRGRLLRRRYRPASTTTALARRIYAHEPTLPPDPTILTEVGVEVSLSDWQAATAIGWGHVEDAARRTSDAYAAVASRVEHPGLLLARSADDGRVVGCAMLSIRDGIATLGAMVTLPGERGRGVQTALIAYRLRLAADAGCDLATSQASSGASLRNLQRLRFAVTHTKTTFERDGRASSDGGGRSAGSRGAG